MCVCDLNTYSVNMCTCTSVCLDTHFKATCKRLNSFVHNHTHTHTNRHAKKKSKNTCAHLCPASGTKDGRGTVPPGTMLPGTIVPEAAAGPPELDAVPLLKGGKGGGAGVCDGTTVRGGRLAVCCTGWLSCCCLAIWASRTARSACWFRTCALVLVLLRVCVLLCAFACLYAS
jgi:hypothetical protein